MRILYVVERFWPYIGGVEVASARVLPELASRGHEIMVITSQDDPRLPEQDEFRGIPVRRLALIEPLADRDPEKLVRVREQLAQLQREWRPDLCHVLFTGPSIYYTGARRDAERMPTVLSFHGSWPGKAHGFLARALATAAWVTACSDSALRDLRAMDPSLGRRSSTILNGMDPPPLPPTPLPFEPPVLLCAGRAVAEKGYDVAVDAMAEVIRAFPTARLIIAGDGTERSGLEHRAAQLGLADHVQLRGWVSPQAIPALINDATAILVPSRREGFGLIALEGALMGRPVIASRVGGLPEAVADGKTGVLVPSDDASALAAAILQLLNNPEEGRRMGRNGREHAIQAFSFQRHADEYEQLYERLAARGCAVAA